MLSELIKLTEHAVTFFAEEPKNVGAKIELEIKLPEGLPMKSFALHGTITDCDFIVKNGANGYLLEMKIEDMSPMNQKILVAYIDFLKRDRILKEAKTDFSQLQKALVVLKKRFTQLAVAVELLRDNVQGTLEMINRDASGKPTLH